MNERIPLLNEIIKNAKAVLVREYQRHPEASLSSAYHRLATLTHPDAYVNESKSVQALATRAFAVLHDAFADLTGVKKKEPEAAKQSNSSSPFPFIRRRFFS